MSASAKGVICMSSLELRPEHRLYSRLSVLHDFYCSQFGEEPEFYVRMPGRVNIIGEHVDYCGYPVLPMAIDQCILLAVGQNAENTFLQIRNVEATYYENFKCDLNALSIDLPANGGPKWYNYYLCGVKGIYDQIQQLSDDKQPFNPLGMTIALSGNIPPASGLSSSSALVSAAALATAHVHQLPLDRRHLAAISARCERYIGTQGGGMDQAIAYLAKAGCAQFIEFHPELNATPVQLPAGVCFIVANSLAAKNKAASSDFNERVVECRLATRIVAKHAKCNNWRRMIRFVELQESLRCTLAELEELVRKLLPKDVYKRNELCAAELEVSAEEFEKEFLTANTRHMTQFKLRQRALHVVQESLRVAKFREICAQTNGDGDSYIANKHSPPHLHNGVNGVHGTSNGSSDNERQENDDDGGLTDSTKRFTVLSQLMRQSHQSLKELYECSHVDLDRLIALSDEAGVGARLTGAGWGGCIVACCDSVEASAKYIKMLKEKYFTLLPPHLLDRYGANDFNDVVFATFPGNGAEIFKFKCV
ncbi:PREDICTED: N-acetylgalactosamine kinase [Rhagoletis zephyria]|uniref:N-acetylgalactosamine kinase n=1 Tax=Rhagoletis zephyria TaxID=28612 RepID=UPI00081181F4|nr:PREDICTED: N-acetylgalactosamine kinase [Rhagoletis zephyria]XP_017485097.1 PREDICTED: N-acetylgalactosamine kinase [Rhagoletis zephyria]XP_017485098.1 PREDICTED: N-acetylgalactosamine kinase [Rhagoletis zephyria]XP_017485099.1 PREDICTED: N-acetylgalactosamine kinase [Rhagoletis zephyria]XP_017485101.1 PREDICTED: N-acetylgalactosamine kinase [Rhagoletis zephyria]XP_017485102.1 PREDICTED: N-acetylgalactosamine kinase [Rhagoletis zephyria]XP_017485103.1 PREDICTED: N-acetylgalactosamine kinas